MNKQQEALKLALAALEYISSHYMSLPKVGCMALAAIEEALAEQPAQQQEPVAWTDLLKKADEIVRGKTVWKRFIDGTPLANDIAVWMADFVQQHTSPPAQRKPLTDEELEAMAEKYVTNCYFDTLKYARAIEAAHSIKE